MKTHSTLIISQEQFRLLFVLPYLLLLIIGMTLPSDGSHGIFSPKSLAFLASVFSLIAYPFFYKTFQPNQIHLILYFTFFCLFLIGWIFISINLQTDISSLYDQFKLLFLTCIVVVMSLFIAQEKLLSYQTFLKVIIYANLAYSLTKIIIVGLFLAGYIDLEFFLEKIGIRFMSMAIYGDITRLQTSVDIVTPFLLFFVLQSTALRVHFSLGFKTFYLIISFLAILLSFSRFLLIAALISIFLGWCNTHLWAKFKWMATIFLIGLIGLTIIGYDRVSSVIELRFYSRDSYQSDSTRTNQIDALLHEFYQYPLLGKGMGSYSEEIIRDRVNLHSYEVQWVAFLMQFGLLGLSLLILPLILIGLQFLIPPLNLIKISCLLVFLLWLSAGLFNPFLISLSSGILYALFAWTGRELKFRLFSSL